MQQTAITDVVFAKRVEGGYQLVGLAEPFYYVAQLPEKCLSTGKPVLLSEEASELIEKVSQRTNELFGFVSTLIVKPVSDMHDGPPPSDPIEAIAKKLAFVKLCAFLSEIPGNLSEQIRNAESKAYSELHKMAYECLKESGQDEGIADPSKKVRLGPNMQELVQLMRLAGMGPLVEGVFGDLAKA